MFRFLFMTVVVMCACLACVHPAVAQEKEPAPANGSGNPKEKTNDDGHDRPTPYPRIRFKPDRIEKVDTAEGGKKEISSRAYLLDLSDAMTATEALDDGTAVSRLDLAKAKMKQALDDLSKRRDLVFNIVTYGSVADFADSKQPVSIDADTIEKAKKWVDERQAGGKSDLYNLLKVLFEQEPTSAQLLVGSDASMPAGVEAGEVERAGGVQEFVLAAVRLWRQKKKTRLDIVGIALDESQREYYRKLAQAGGGLYLDG